MSQSLYTAMSGIASATTELEVISNNVANINTTAFKKSSVNFSDVYSTTISSGSVATSTSGGTNPVQIGVGTQVSSVSKDFSAGSATSTGITTDLMIQDDGFFSIQGNDGTIYYTRAGNFTFDSDGNLVTSEGYQVMGTDSIMSATTSTNTVSIPLSICADVTGTDSVAFAVETVSNMNALEGENITSGDFNISLTTTTLATTAGGGYAIGDVVGTETYNAKITGLEDLNTGSTMQQLADMLENGSGTLTGLNCSYTNSAGVPVAVTGVAVTVNDGSLSFDFSLSSLVGTDTTGTPNTATSISSIAYSSTGLEDTTNFLTVTGFDDAVLSGNKVTSDILDYSVNITELSSASEAISKTSTTINDDGSIQVTYDDGSVLSVQLGENGKNYEFIYTTVDGVQIAGAECDVSTDLAVPGNFVIQMATVTNTNGLLSVGSNLYATGPNSGDVVYTVAGQMGCGNVSSGYLESSNVDLSEELANMILAQRAVEANSRVFSTTSDVLDTIVNMAR